MTRRDLIANELHLASTYEREAKLRTKQPQLKAALLSWAQASRARAEHLRSGPLFGAGGDA